MSLETIKEIGWQLHNPIFGQNSNHMKAEKGQQIYVYDHLLKVSRTYSNNIKIKSKQKFLNSKRLRVKATIVSNII